MTTGIAPVRRSQADWRGASPARPFDAAPELGVDCPLAVLVLGYPGRVYGALEPYVAAHPQLPATPVPIERDLLLGIEVDPRRGTPLATGPTARTSLFDSSFPEGVAAP